MGRFRTSDRGSNKTQVPRERVKSLIEALQDRTSEVL